MLGLILHGQVDRDIMVLSVKPLALVLQTGDEISHRGSMPLLQIDSIVE